jgi:hypothetical protein
MSFLGRIGVLVGPLVLGCASKADSHEECSRRIAELEAENGALSEQVDALERRLQLVLEKTGVHVISHAWPPPIDAYVLDVKRDLKLVVLNKGKKDGVKEGYTFSIYRGSKFKGQARVQDVQESMCSALITGEKSPIERGDSASTSL